MFSLFQLATPRLWGVFRVQSDPSVMGLRDVNLARAGSNLSILLEQAKEPFSDPPPVRVNPNLCIE
jgi:hypothetical protein